MSWKAKYNGYPGLLNNLTPSGPCGRAAALQGLFVFNVGVEVGQLMFVAAVLVVQFLIKKIKVKWPAWAEQMPEYAIGSLACSGSSNGPCHFGKDKKEH